MAHARHTNMSVPSQVLDIACHRGLGADTGGFTLETCVDGLARNFGKTQDQMNEDPRRPSHQEHWT